MSSSSLTNTTSNLGKQQQQQYKKDLSTSSNCSNMSKHSPNILLQRSTFLANRGRFTEAMCAATTALTLATDNNISVLTPYFIQIASIHFAQADHQQAEIFLRKAIQLDPNSDIAMSGLATVLQACDPINIPECLTLLKNARQIVSQRLKDKNIEQEQISIQLATLLTDIGVRMKTAGLPASAIQHYQQALLASPQYAQAHYNLGVAYADMNEIGKAKSWYEKCLKYNPSHVEAWCNLGVLHKNQGNIDLAIQAYEQALSLNPNYQLAKGNLALTLCEKGTLMKKTDRNMARLLYKKSLALQPSLADAHYNLGVLYAERGKLQRALVSYNLAVSFRPDMTEAHNNLGVVHKELGNLPKALECYKRALQSDRQHHQTHNNIAVVYTLLGEVDKASEHLQLANLLSPQYAEAHNNIGVLLRDQGDIDSAITHYEKCTQLDPTAIMAAQNRLHALSYSEFWTKDAVYKEHVKWGLNFQEFVDKEIIEASRGSQANNPVALELLRRIHNAPIPDTTPRGRDCDRRLRIGYVSPDFFTHSVSYFAELLLKGYDENLFEVYAYANVAQPDGKTERFQQLVGKRWRNIWSQTACDAAKMILNDEIDVLVELAGHTANNRLDLMALRLAPVQVTWIGYPNTTGLKSIHYRVTDAIVDPPDTSQQFSEKLWRLPDAFLCYTPSPEAPEEVSLPPVLSSGGIITFGSFNVLSKIQARTVRLWAEILKQVPDSRLLMKAKPFGAPTAKKRIIDMFAKENITADRLDLVPLIPSTRSHLQVYSNVDIGLDPFPYAGTTTTCEAIYMGVPVITLGTSPENGDHAHNVGVTLMSIIGHSELVALSEEDYIKKAVDLALDIERLKKVRSNLRDDMIKSPLGNSTRYMKNVEAMYYGMWKERGGIVEGEVAKMTEVQTRNCFGIMDDECVSTVGSDERSTSPNTSNSTLKTVNNTEHVTEN